MSDNYGNQLNTMNDAIADKLDGNAVVYYSAYKTSKATGDPLNNLNSIAVRGKVIFREKTDAFWADGGKDYQSEVLENPTWLDVAVAADEMIRTTGDRHHIYLESIHPMNEKIDGVKVYEFWMGS